MSANGGVGGATGDGQGGFTTTRGNDTSRYGETQHEGGALDAVIESHVFAHGAFKARLLGTRVLSLGSYGSESRS